MKKMKRLLLWSVLGCLAAGCIGCNNKEVSYTTAASAEAMTQESTVEATVVEEKKETEAMAENISEDSYMEQVVAEAILEENSKWFAGEECVAEGHIILEEVEEDGISTIYALMMYGEYGFQNVDYFIKSAGTGVIPVVMKFDLRLSNSTPLVLMELPEDGSGYNESIKRMFPEHLWDRTLSIQEEDRIVLEEMERGYAERYLEELGRDAVIGSYSDVEHTYLTDYGVSVEVSNKMLEYEKNMGPYPSWHGSLEKIEDGERYLYSVYVNEEAGQIEYEKRIFGTMETVEKFVYDMETGEAITD